MFHQIIYLICFVCLAYGSLSVLFLAVLSFSGRFFPRKGAVAGSGADTGLAATKKIAILVPAYKEDGIILSTAQNHLALDYPRSLYDVYILADSFRADTIVELRKLPIQVLEMSFEKSTKIKSLNDAFRRMGKDYDIAIISDADNVLARDFLRRIARGFAEGAQVIQGRRVAKNMDTSFALLDACSEGINNHIFRRGSNALGLSAPLIGSGMAFEYRMIREMLKGIDSVVEDKILQLKLVQQGYFIQYMEGALIFDEKVDSPEAFERQRRRWVSGQFINLKEYFLPGLRELFRGNISYFNFAVMNNLVLPRAFLLVLLPILVVAGFLVHPSLGIWAAALLFTYLLSLVIAIPHEMINRDLFRALLKLPKAIFVMAGTLFRMKKSNKTFIHTVHTKTEISNSLFNDHGK
ncbi:MAG TPA: glycosyltransferase family 2 protein [Puia sp.]|jgi:cellulose synthase/poly-beta-1,6-N-acetylglucosamine synthase-like glycosyltransferase